MNVLKMATTLEIKLKKVSKIYYEGDMVSGIVVVSSPSDVKHDGLTLQMEGAVNLQLSSKNVGIFEAFYNSVKPINLINYTIDLASPGKIPSGITEIPFEVPLQPRQTISAGYPGILETYHGVFVNVTYVLRCHMKRSFLAKQLNTSCQFVVQYKQSTKQYPKNPVRCIVNPQTIQAMSPSVETKSSLPSFHIIAELDSTICALDKPFTGQLCVQQCSVPIKSIELQLVRVETCGCAEGYARDATEIQNIQLGEGDVCRDINIPIYMIFPRLFTCPTTTTTNFKIEFEVNIAIIFQDDYLVTENFPITLVRIK